jgi:hypothetical protein
MALGSDRLAHFDGLDGCDRQLRFDGCHTKPVGRMRIVSQTRRELAYFSTSGYLSEAGSSIKRFSTGFFRGFIVGKRLLKVILNIDIFL